MKKTLTEAIVKSILGKRMMEEYLHDIRIKAANACAEQWGFPLLLNAPPKPSFEG